MDVPCDGRGTLVQVKNPTIIKIWLLLGFYPATRSVQSTPADNAREGVRQYIKVERKSHPE